MMSGVDRPQAVTPVPRWVPMLGSLLSVAGVGVAGYLTYAHYASPSVLACPDRGVIDCAKVTTSSYSSFHGLPVAVIGLGYFAAMAVLHHPRLWRQPHRSVRWGRLGLAGAGVATALWLLYVELFRLDAICLYCSAAHLVALALFVVTAFGTTVATPAGTFDDEPGIVVDAGRIGGRDKVR
jgi:uncharacterized membrane protein